MMVTMMAKKFLLVLLLAVLVIAVGCKKTEDEKSKEVKLAVLELKTAGGSNIAFKSGFNGNTSEYEAEVTNATTCAAIIAVAADAKASVTGTGLVILNEGSNNLKVKVIAEDHAYTKTYTINIKRAVKISDEAKLKSLELFCGGARTVFTPAFSSEITSYSAIVEYNVTNAAITCSAVDIKSEITGGGIFALVDGNNVFKIVTTAEDKKTTKEYKITITRKVRVVRDGTFIYFEKPVSWSGAALKYKINDSTSLTGGQMLTYRPDWYGYEVKKAYSKFEFFIYNGTEKFDNGGANYIITQKGEYWIKSDGTMSMEDPYNPAAEGILFNSRNIKYKSPFGAVPAGTETTFAFETAKDVITEANLVIENQNIVGDRGISYSPYETIKMTKVNNGYTDMWEVKHTLNTKGVYGYYFEIFNGTSKRYLCGAAKRMNVAHYNLPLTGGDGVVFRGFPIEGEFIQTVYDPSFKTPDWAKDTIYYYIFPERFRNGNKTNDPKVGVDKFYGNKDIEVHADWLDTKPWVPGTADGNSSDDGEWCNDFYGGDLAGITEKLDYLKELGINTIYTNPIFEAPSNHKYDTADYMKIDNSFGTLSDFENLISRAKEKGMRVILDTSLNHSGSDSVYMDRYGKYDGLGAFENEVIKTDSSYYDWYLWNPGAASADGKYNQWANPTLATLNPNSQSYRDFAFRNSDSVTKYWLKEGAAGWRMDVAPWKPDDFWREWRTAVKAQDSDAVTVAECWFDSSKYFLGDTFDSAMNYIFKQAVLSFAGGAKTAKDVNDMLEVMRENYPMESFYVLMNLLSTHDAARALNDFGCKEAGDASYGTATEKLKLAVLFQMTYPGAPAIYYGDEVGMTGGADPDNRGPYPWEDVGGSPDKTLLASIKSLVKMRNDNIILRRGTLEPIYTDNNIMVMKRTYNGKNAVVILNNKNADVNVEIPVAGITGTLTDVLNSGSATVVDGQIKLTVKALWGAVLAD